MCPSYLLRACEETPARQPASNTGDSAQNPLNERYRDFAIVNPARMGGRVRLGILRNGFPCPNEVRAASSLEAQKQKPSAEYHFYHW
jgi:hypothetical protein